MEQEKYTRNYLLEVKESQLANLEQRIHRREIGEVGKPSSWLFAQIVVRQAGCNLTREEVEHIATRLRYRPSVFYKNYLGWVERAREYQRSGGSTWDRWVSTTWWARLEELGGEQEEDSINWEERRWRLVAQRLPNYDYEWQPWYKDFDKAVRFADEWIKMYKEQLEKERKHNT